jgi:hypothetical protein
MRQTRSSGVATGRSLGQSLQLPSRQAVNANFWGFREERHMQYPQKSGIQSRSGDQGYENPIDVTDLSEDPPFRRGECRWEAA